MSPNTGEMYEQVVMVPPREVEAVKAMTIEQRKRWGAAHLAKLARRREASKRARKARRKSRGR